MSITGSALPGQEGLSMGFGCSSFQQVHWPCMEAVAQHGVVTAEVADSNIRDIAFWNMS